MTISAVQAMDWVLAACAVVLMIAAGFTLFRLERGPSILDRVVAFDVLTSVMIGSLSLLAAFAGRAELIPVIAVLAMVGFVGSVAVARFVAAERPDDTKILTKAEIDRILLGTAPTKGGAQRASHGETAGKAGAGKAKSPAPAARPAAEESETGASAVVQKKTRADGTAGPEHIERPEETMDPEQYAEDQILRTEAQIEEQLADEIVEGEVVDGPMYPGVVYREQEVGDDD